MSHEFTVEAVELTAGHIWDHTTDCHPAHLENLRCVATMLHAYAATLRQQAARVDEVEAKARELHEAYRADNPDARMVSWDQQWEPTREHWREKARAALSAQPAPERQGEDVVDCVAKALADAIGHGMREKCEHMAHAAIAAYQLATWGDTHTAAPVGVPADTRRLQFVLDHVPHSVLGAFGVLPEDWMDLPEGEAHISDARTCIDANLAAAPSAPQGTQERK